MELKLNRKKNMHIYFGKVDLEEFSDVPTKDLFENNGKYYWYKAVIEEDQICFFDTCGRNFPIANEHINQTDMALFAAGQLHDAREQGRKAILKAEQRVLQLMKHWEKDE